ncbi:MAG: hypothetical protein RIQ52_1907 [Pseudomonadota bacterium]|jgi:uncharacterized protein YgfB (UPF0149 family)
MNASVSPDYREIQAIVYELGASAAEAHGLLSGLLCLDGRLGSSQWLEKLLGKEAATLAAQDEALMEQLFHYTRDDMAAADFSYSLLLPDDDEALTERAQALGEWCQGFLMGLGYQQGAEGMWPGDASEILEDILQIASIDPMDVAESDEGDYLELQEYLRAGVQLIRSELEQASLHARAH